MDRAGMQLRGHPHMARSSPRRGKPEQRDYVVNKGGAPDQHDVGAFIREWGRPCAAHEAKAHMHVRQRVGPTKAAAAAIGPQF